MDILRKVGLPAIILIVLAAGENIFAQDTQIRGFVDSQFGLLKSDSSTDNHNNHGFAVGQFDLFITSQINDRISFLGETVFEWAPEVNDWALDVERIILKYSIKDYFNISAGKFHTAFGYWNNAYHHGALIQPTINRPVIVRFEDNGGYLPIHQVGMQISGTAITRKNIGYNFFVSNGQSRGNTGGAFDYSQVAISGNVSAEPVENLQFIVSAYSTKVPAGSITYQGISLGADSKYTLLNGTVAYFNPSSHVEFATEYYRVTNQMTTKTTSNAFYYYAGFHASKKLTPYMLYNRVTFEQDESYFAQNGLHEITLGVRYQLASKAILKLEYTHSDSELYKKSDLVQTQFAIGF